MPPQPPTAAPARPGRAGPREWAGLAVLTLPVLVLALDVSVLFLAAPHLEADLRPSAAQSLWIMDIYGFLIAGFLVTMGTVGDRFGRRRLLIVGGAAFAVASVLTAYAPSAGTLIAARALLGVAGATLMPSTLALIGSMFTDARQRGFAIAVWMTTMMLGVAAGPLVGGVMLEHFWWGSVFLLGVPVMALLVLLAPVTLPEYRDPAPGAPDLPSIALSLAALLPAVYAVKQLATDGPGPVVLASAAAGLLAGRAFVRRQRRIPHPLLDLGLFRDRAFSAALGLLLFGLVAINALEYLLPQYLQLVVGLSPSEAGLWTVPVILAGAVGSLLAPVLARYVRPVSVIAGGALLSVAGFVLVARVESTGSLPVLLTGTAIALAGITPIPVLTTDLVVAAAPKEKAGSAAALSETGGELGIGLGVALAGSVVAAVYGARTAAAPGSPAGESLSDAHAAAERLPDEAADELLHLAREAFTAGLNTVGTAGAILMTVLGAGALTLLRRRKTSG
ncbi:MFS transporter [Streptomyces sp. NPDC020141]|uniref:MFS transporter n=1 Tax=Streptomyces sp. NPDC020141 TaxID=3365065 RepID=UPI003799BB02